MPTPSVNEYFFLFFLKNNESISSPSLYVHIPNHLKLKTQQMYSKLMGNPNPFNFYLLTLPKGYVGQAR